jgi:hypothetical protein
MPVRLSKLFGDRAEILLAVLLLSSLVLVKPRIAESDAIEYFSYLPSILLDHDLDFTNEYTAFYLEDPEGRQGFKETFLDLETATGLKINFGPIGTAVLWAPFYVAAHAGALIGQALGFDVVADGLSIPYRWAVAIGSMLYGAVGLLLSYRLARRYGSEWACFIAVLALWWATPVAYYMYVAPGMNHAVSLFAVALFFTLWRWAATGSPLRWAVWGASAGLMALVREQDGLFALVALIAALSPRLETDWVGRIKRLVAFGLASAVVFSPQLMVYFILYGRPAPAPQIQNKMYWTSPHFFEVLFSPQHGLFFWSPILLLFLIGGLLLFRRDLEAALVLAVGFVSQVYISGAVDSWTQAGAFGSRRFLGATVIFAVWGGWIFYKLTARIRKVGVAGLAAVFILWNVSLMIQFGLGIMDRQRLVWSQIVHNHIYEVPPRLGSVISRYLKAQDKMPDQDKERP